MPLAQVGHADRRGLHAHAQPFEAEVRSDDRGLAQGRFPKGAGQGISGRESGRRALELGVLSLGGGRRHGNPRVPRRDGIFAIRRQ